MAKALTAETPSTKTTTVLLAILSMVDWLIDIPYKIKNKNNHKSNAMYTCFSIYLTSKT